MRRYKKCITILRIKHENPKFIDHYASNTFLERVKSYFRTDGEHEAESKLIQTQNPRNIATQGTVAHTWGTVGLVVLNGF